MLWLPLQGAMAASMSLCPKEKGSVKLDTSALPNVGTLPCAQERITPAEPDKLVAADADQHHNVSHEHSMQDITDEATSNLQCNGGSCQASCSAPIPLVTSGAIFVDIDSPAYTLSFASRFTSLVPEQLQRPPLV